jgi:curli production assembly/transport component CsgF
MSKKITYFCLLLVCQYSFASELVYTPVNPNFGGSPLNGAALLSAASAQNSYQAKSASSTATASSSSSTTSTALTAQQKLDQAFKDGLNRQILSRLQQIIVNKAFGTTGTDASLADGATTVGDYTITNDTINNTISVTSNLSGEVLVTIDLSQMAP